MDKKLTNKQKLYIRDSFDTKSPSEMAEYLQIDSEIICNFIMDELQCDILTPEKIADLDILRDMGIFETAKTIAYNISFELKDTGDVEINMEWPSDASSKEFIENVGTLLHMIHNGQMKSMIGDNLTKLAQEEGMIEQVVGAIHKWDELDKSNGSEPCINPYEVF